MTARERLLVGTVLVAAAAVTAVGVLTHKAGHDSDLPPLGLLKRPTGIVGVQLPFEGWRQAIAGYAQEALVTEDQKQLLREVEIEAKYFHFSQF